MKDWCRVLGYGILMWWVTGFIGCTPIEPLSPPPSTPVSVSAFTSVVGNWAGILRRRPPSLEEDWMTLMIQDDGSYEYVSVQTIDRIFYGKGTLTLIDGKFRAETERGWALVVPYEESGRRMLKIEGATKDGVQYAADLGPTK